MKILRSDLKKGEMKVRVENPDDVLVLNRIIAEGDFVSGFCERKIKIGTGENAKSVKKSYFLKILAEKKDFEGNELRVNGKTVEEKEDIPKGSYQTIEAIPGAEIVIEKNKWSAYHLQKLKDSAVESRQKIMIVVCDRESAIFAVTKKSGFDILLELSGDVQKKGHETKKESRFFQDVVEQIKDYAERYKITNIILASPAFWKEEIIKLVKEKELRQKILLAGCGSVSENAVYEVLKSDAIQKVLENERAAKEIALVDEVVKEISTEGAVAYGIDDVADKISGGNVRVLLFTDKFFSEGQKKSRADYAENLIETAEKTGAEMHIISSDHEGGMRLDGLGGIAALLRYKSYS